MCGICGKVTIDPKRRPAEELIQRMCSRLVHRGPDDSGVYCAPGIGLGHRRLSIIDLSPEAAQPLTNEDETLYLVVNGEIYNYKPLRQQLEKKGHTFRTATDSEIILHLYEDKGTALLEEIEGMFSFALWDSRSEKLFAACDRTGQKPFVFWHDDNNLVFASELQAILADRSIPRDVNTRALFDYLALYYVPAPLTAYKHIHRLLPGHFMTFHKGQVTITRYWELPRKRLAFIGSQEEVAHQLRTKIRTSVERRLQADVAVGVFLSGGIDSSIIAAEAARLKPETEAFTVRFSDAEFDESPYAQYMAAELGLKIHTVEVQPDAADLLPRLIQAYGEPFADSSCIPTYCIAREAAQHVKVILSGDGGDEIFGGYRRYRAYRYQLLMRLLPGFIRSPLISAARLLGRGGSRNSFRRMMYRFADTLHSRGFHYSDLLFLMTNSEKTAALHPAFLETVDDPHMPTEALITHLMVQSGSPDMGERAMRTDFQTYLPGDLLRKVDIASMANSLEVRSPYLDTDIITYASALPFMYKINRGNHKYILKEAYKSLLPRSIRKRSKMGFAVPLADYLAGPLKSMFNDIVGSSHAYVRQVFRPAVIDTLLTEKPVGLADSSFRFAVLMLELWHTEFFKTVETDDGQ